MNSTGNSILDALDEEERGRLDPSLEEVDLPLKLELFSPGHTDGYCYFPTTAIVSLLRGFENGTQVEIAVVGREGFAGLHGILGEDLEPSTGVVQYSGKALRVEAALLKEVFWAGRAFQRISLRFVYALISQISQTAACNQLHLVDQRLARWFLSMWDRADGDELHLTHEFLALMLGVTRSRVTQSMRKLAESGAIGPSRNKVQLLDRAELERASCECYAESYKAYGALFTSGTLPEATMA